MDRTTVRRTYQADRPGFIFAMPLSASLEQVWTFLWHARWIHIQQFWHRKALGDATNLSPTLLFLLSGLLLLRMAERQFSGLLLKEPPRSIW